MTTPQELEASIRTRQFDRVIKGYKPEQVEGFMNRLLTQYEALYAKNKELEEELEALKRDQEILKETLFHAQETASKIITEAKQESELERERASKEANRIIQDASDKAEIILEQARRTEEELRKSVGQQYEKHRIVISKLVEEYYYIFKKHIQALESELLGKLESSFETLKDAYNASTFPEECATLDPSLIQMPDTFKKLRDKEEMILVGKRLNKDIINASGQLVVPKGQVVTPQLLSELIEKELYGQLIAAVG